MSKKNSNKEISISSGTQIKLIRKSNKLVEARYKFDIWEMRVFVKMISLIRPEDKDFAQYTISVNDIIQDFGLHNNGSYYNNLRDASKKLLTKQVDIEKTDENGKRKRITANLISSTESYVDEEDGKDIILKFDPELKKHLLDLKEQYLTYDIRNILKLTSVYSIRIYELLKQYEGMIEDKGYAIRKFEIDELKNMLGISPEEYSLYGHFKSKVLAKAQKDLVQETDIRFELEEEKEGRKVVRVCFLIYENNSESDPSTLSPELSRLYEPIKDHISLELFKVWGALYPIEQIETAINYTRKMQEEGKVKNFMKYLQKMVKVETLVEEEQKKIEVEEKIKSKKEASEKRKEEQANKEKQTQELKSRYLKARENILLHFIENDSDLYKLIYEDLKTEASKTSPDIFKETSYNRLKSFLEGKELTKHNFVACMRENELFQAYIDTYVDKKYPNIFKEIEKKYKEESQKLGIYIIT